MRVLHVVTLHTPTHDFGGPTRVALNLSHGLRERGVQAAVVALGDGFPGPLPREVDGVPARLFPARHVLPRFEVSGITSPSLLARARRLVRSADVVHVHLMRDLVTLPVALAALSCRRPLVLQTHGMIDPTEKPVAQARRRSRVCAGCCAGGRVLHLTEQERRDVAGRRRAAPDGPGVPAGQRGGRAGASPCARRPGARRRCCTWRGCRSASDRRTSCARRPSCWRSTRTHASCWPARTPAPWRTTCCGLPATSASATRWSTPAHSATSRCWNSCAPPTCTCCRPWSSRSRCPCWRRCPSGCRWW